MSAHLDKVPGSSGELQDKNALTPRSYQLEMVEESMQRNIIVAMDTGSGKTLIAILRIQAELERCPAHKLVWFCVPTVALAYQQHRNISAQLPAYQSRVLSGKDNCEFWSEKTWTEVVKGTRIVISTHDILLDALVHAFISINQLALLVFDEAHRATKDHPANGLMKRFYHPAESGERPYILGLSASPLVNGKVDNLSVLESNLDAISRTPRLHRSELVKFVHKPELIRLAYRPHNLDHTLVSSAFQTLAVLYQTYDLDQDPWIMKMRSDPRTRSSNSLLKAVMSQKTTCRDHLRKFLDRSKNIAAQLGPWAADMYIRQCVARFRISRAQSFADDETIKDREKAHLQNILDEIETSAVQHSDFDPDKTHITPKVQALVDFLKDEDVTTFSGLVFVQTRAEVAVLSQVLMLHPLTESFLITTFVGESMSANRKLALWELADVKNQKTTLDDLRTGRKNLIVTTEALEEGIDISACNVVVCFEKPPTLKSFVQRRGRARKEVSKYAIMLEDGSDPNTVAKFQELEDMMRHIYEDEMRELEQRRQSDDSEADGYREFCIEATGARLSLSDAVSHLYHFCNTLPPDPYTERAPIFFFEDSSSRAGDRIISARVVLPCSVDISVREARSKQTWATEKNAKRDVAFEAYVALYNVGLIDDHLLPLGRIDPEAEKAKAIVEKRPNLVDASDQIEVWPGIAAAWKTATELHQTLIVLCRDGRTVLEMILMLPITLPPMEDFSLCWDADTTYKVSTKPFGVNSLPASLAVPKRITLDLLSSMSYGRTNRCRDDLTALFVPLGLEPSDTSGWNTRRSICDEHDELDECLEDENHFNVGLIRDRIHTDSPHIFQCTKSATYQDIVEAGVVDLNQQHKTLYKVLGVRRFPKRTDFLHEIFHSDDSPGKQSDRKWLLADSCEVDNLPWKFSLFSAFIPSILHMVQKNLVVDQLCNTLLSPLQIKDRTLICTAISASSAREPTDYQRFEFLGDSILKMSTSLVLMATHLNYHEGILSHKKDHIVSNGSLSSAAIKAELDQFILTKPFTGRKWRPLYNSDFERVRLAKAREISTKTLADVVESLIGAATLDGGTPKALDCLSLFFPHIPWSIANEAETILCGAYDLPIKHSGYLSTVESLLSYTFRRKALLVEAITHPSHREPYGSASYQRLEFLGDSILDNIVTVRAFNCKPPIPTQRLHLVRSALVNANFLGYLCIRFSIIFQRAEVDSQDPKMISTYTTEVPFALWQAMRHSSPAVGAAQQACLARHGSVQQQIANAIAIGSRYPWTLLARLEPPKFFSDIVESLLGAIWIDSHASIPTCTAFLERLGLISYLTRVTESSDIALLHPKEELGRLADQDRVQYVPGVQEDEEGRKRRTCSVMMGEREVVSVGDGLSKMEVETRAADEACKILRREGRRLGKGKNRAPKTLGREDAGGDEGDDDDGDGGDGDCDNDDDRDTRMENADPHSVRPGAIEQGSGRKRKIDDDADDDDTIDEWLSAEE